MAAAATVTTEAIRVVIDIRETDLWEELAAYRLPEDGTVPAEGWWVEKATLDVGDICFYKSSDPETPLAVLERKKAEDLGASQKDGRYREQRARLFALRGAGTSIGYLIETPAWSPTLSRSWCRGTFNEVHLQQAIVRLQFRYSIPVFIAANLKENVQWIRRIAKMLNADCSVFQTGVAATACEAAAAYTEAIHVKKADNNTPERIFLSFLLAIPGLGKVAAEAVSTRVTASFKALQELTEDELSEIQAGKRKIGKSLAKVIYDAVHS